MNPFAISSSSIVYSFGRNPEPTVRGTGFPLRRFASGIPVRPTGSLPIALPHRRRLQGLRCNPLRVPIDRIILFPTRRPVKKAFLVDEERIVHNGKKAVWRR
ncbi:hypothetical protein [Sediminispirochaeta bajacaliforniensis]|uniref:hypothetical protein n=1 Tax=Sediminispirochaeta bajacaliforniensis TaxID=148 RepID=UPI0012B5D605|nr:hypothetical protein [Sediminispirochaeta bajacaliforniensis]